MGELKRKVARQVRNLIEDVRHPVTVRHSVVPDSSCICSRYDWLPKRSLPSYDDGDLPDVVRTATPRAVRRKVVRVFRDAVFWPALSLVQVNDEAVDAHGELDDKRLQKILDRGYARRYPVREVDGYCTSIDSLNRSNYYHWFVECLPRVWALHAEPFRHIGAIHLFTRRVFRREELQIFNALLPDNVHVHRVSEKIRVRASRYIHIPIPTESGVGCLPDEYVAFYRGIARKVLGLSAPPIRMRKLFVSRGNATRRRITNEAEVRQVLERAGYECHAMDGLSLRDQALLFGSATHIVAQHGAALTNLLYATPGAHVTEIHASRRHPGGANYYRYLARSCGLTHDAIWLDQRAKNDNYTLSPEVLDRVVSAGTGLLQPA